MNDLITDEPTVTGSLRTELAGDQDRARGFVNLARTILGGSRSRMGVNQRIAEGEPGGYYMTQDTLPDGTVIQTITNDGMDTIRVHATTVIEEDNPVKLEEGRPEDFFAVCGWYEDANWYPHPWHWEDKPVNPFTLIPEVAPYHWGEARAISWDGDFVTGYLGADTENWRTLFLWVNGSGTTIIPTLNAHGHVDGNAISADGTVIAGETSGIAQHAFAWSASGAVLMTRHASETTPQAGATAIAADGELVVGWSGRGNGHGSNNIEGVIWDAATGAMVTEIPHPGTFDTATKELVARQTQRTYSVEPRTLTSTQEAIYYPETYNTAGYIDVTNTASDGTVTKRTDPNSERAPRYPYTVVSTRVEYTGVGTTQEKDTYIDTVSWNVPHLMKPLGCSYDAAMVVGICGPKAFHWSAETGVTLLPYLTGHTRAEAHAISADGTVVVGKSQDASGFRWFYWTPLSGTVDAGTGQAARAISQGGVTAVGQSKTVGTDGLAVMRGMPDEFGVINEINLSAMFPVAHEIASATGVTLIDMWHHPDGSTTYDPDMPGLEFLFP